MALRIPVRALCALPQTANAQEPALDRERYYSAVDYCRRNVLPMVLSPDKQILCFTGMVTSYIDLSIARDLEQEGLFVVRSPGGNIKAAIELFRPAPRSSCVGGCL